MIRDPAEQKNIEVKIAKIAESLGGRAYYVGGCVRDSLMGRECKDVDIEVHGVAPAALKEALAELGNVRSFGQSFGVFSIDGFDIDIAMPRKEKATGRGHRDFEVSVDPFIGTREAARRRDFTVNSMMRDVLSGELIDPFSGREDLKKGILRCVDPASFAEDPLRVLRAAQFAARFEFEVESKTQRLCSSIDISTLSKERVEGELKKALLTAKKPSVFFEVLRQMDQLLCWFSGLVPLIGLEQDAKFHPEGDVWTHTMQVIDRGAGYRDKTSDPYNFMLLCLTHDFGKILTTEKKDGRIHAYGHEVMGDELIESFLRRFTDEGAVFSYVKNMVPLHMKPNVMAFSRSSVKKTNAMFDEAAAPLDLVYFSMCDKPVFSGDEPFTGDSGFLFDRLEEYRKTMEKPFVSGRDLIAEGLEPGNDFSEILGYAHKLRLAGIEKKDALKQTVSYARKLRKSNAAKTAADKGESERR